MMTCLYQRNAVHCGDERELVVADVNALAVIFPCAIVPVTVAI